MLRLYSLLITIFYALHATAQTQRLYRVDSTHTLQSDARYAIVYHAVNGSGDTLYYALTHDTYKKGLRTTPVSMQNGALQVNDSKVLWQLQPHSHGAYIGHSASRFLGYKSDRSLHYQAQKSAEAWTLEWLPTGTLNIKTAGKTFRLAPRTNSPEEAALLLSSSQQLEAMLYKVAHTIAMRPSLDSLHEGQSVGLLSNLTQTLLGHTMATTAIEMQNGSWLTHDSVTTWRISHLKGTLFALESQGNMLLPTMDFGLDTSSIEATASVWQLQQGRVVYLHQGQAYALATHVASPQRLSLCPIQHIDSTTWQAVSLVALCPPLTAHTIAPQHTLLSGGYTPEVWKQVPWESHQCYDISQVILPREITQLPCPDIAKTSLILAYSPQGRYLKDWPKVLLRQDDTYTPLHTTTTTAIAPWHWPTGTTMTDTTSWTLTYPPTTDVGWHTGVLPFSADVSHLPFRFATLSLHDGQLRCTPTSTLRAGEAFIYQGLTQGATLSITAPATPWTTTALPSVLTGCSDTLLITPHTPTTYLLNQQGTHFIVASPGSIVLPGRAYLRLAVGASAPTALSIDTLISNITTTPSTTSLTAYYDTHGRLVGHYPNTPTATLHLPKGLYIHQGKLIPIR